LQIYPNISFCPTFEFMTMDNLERILSRYKIRKTTFRFAVLRIFLEYPHAAIKVKTVEDSLGHFDRITLYRTLKTFQEKGLIHKVHDGSQDTKYALCYEKECSIHSHGHEHAHFHCTDCGQSYCLADIGHIDIKLPKNYDVQQIDLSLKGVCDSCS